MITLAYRVDHLETAAALAFGIISMIVTYLIIFHRSDK